MTLTRSTMFFIPLYSFYIIALLGLASGENRDVARQQGMTKASRESLRYERMLSLSESKDDDTDFEESSLNIIEEEDDDDDGDVDSIIFLRTECIPVGECELCSGSSLYGFTACGVTGRRQKYECPQSEGENTNEYFSCRRTPSDESFLMIKFQLFCLFTAIISLRHIRREKVVNASLFEQRGRRRIKQEMTVLNSNNNNTGKGNISDALTLITSFGSQEGETVPMLGNGDNADQV